jgi:hypothetical protein
MGGKGGEERGVHGGGGGGGGEYGRGCGEEEKEEEEAKRGEGVGEEEEEEDLWNLTQALQVHLGSLSTHVIFILEIFL